MGEKKDNTVQPHLPDHLFYCYYVLECAKDECCIYKKLQPPQMCTKCILQSKHGTYSPHIQCFSAFELLLFVPCNKHCKDHIGTCCRSARSGSNSLLQHSSDSFTCYFIYKGRPLVLRWEELIYNPSVLYILK